MDTPQAPPEQPVFPNAAKLPCMNCNQEMSVRIPTPRIVNMPDCTIVCFAHEKLDKCPHCQAVYLFNIDGINEHMQLALGWKRLMPKEPASGLVTADSNTLKQTIANSKLGTRLKVQ